MTKCSAKDRISELYPEVNEDETPLPRAWSSQDKFTYIGLSQNNLRAHYKGVGKTHKDAASVRAGCPIPAACGLYYFEIKVVSKGRDGYIGVGLCAAGVNMNKLPGWEKDSYGYHADDGHSFCTSGAGEDYGPTFTTGDVVGCGVNLIEKTCFYTKNGVNLGIAFRDLIPNLYPTVGLQTPGEIVDVNFGQQAFVFDINEMRKELVANTLRTIQNFPASQNDASWQASLQRIISAYLVHHGYCATAECFARNSGQSITEELSSIRNRQRIQKLILAGRISEAIDTTQSLYPSLLDRNPHLFFQLKCRQFIEMVNGCDGEVRPLAHSPTRSTRNSPCVSPSRTLSHSNSPSSCSSVANNSLSASQSQSQSQTREQNSESMESSNDHSQNGVKNGADDSDMMVDEYFSNGYSKEDEYYDIHESEIYSHDENRTSTNVSVITSSSKVMDPGPSMRQLCGGNIFSIEKLIAFGKTLQNIYKDMTNEIGNNPENENLMKEAFSLLAYNNPHDSPVGYLLDPIQREGICSSLNSVILEAHKLPGQPALERAIGQAKSCLKLMGKNGLGASAMVKVEDFYVDR